MDNSELIAEFFNKDTSQERRDEIKHLVGSSDLNDDEKILIELGSTVNTQNEIDLLKSRVLNLREPQRQNWYPLKIVASIALLFSIAILVFRQTNTSNEPHQVFSSYYSPYDGAIVARGQNNSFSSGINSYNVGDFEEALRVFLELEGREDFGDQFILLISSCYLSLGDPDKSILWLGKISQETTNSIIDSNRIWYLALSHLKKNEIEKSRVLLERLVAAKSAFSGVAKELLSEEIFS